MCLFFSSDWRMLGFVRHGQSKSIANMYKAQDFINHFVLLINSPTFDTLHWALEKHILNKN